MVALLVLGLLLPLANVQAGLAQAIFNTLMNGMLSLLLKVLAAAFALFVAAFIAIVQYDFANVANDAVDITWRLVRDISNLFFTFSANSPSF